MLVTTGRNEVIEGLNVGLEGIILRTNFSVSPFAWFKAATFGCPLFSFVITITGKSFMLVYVIIRHASRWEEKAHRSTINGVCDWISYWIPVLVSFSFSFSAFSSLHCFISDAVMEAKEMTVRTFHRIHGWNMMLNWLKSIDSFAPCVYTILGSDFGFKSKLMGTTFRIWAIWRSFCFGFFPSENWIFVSCLQMLVVTLHLTSTTDCGD